MFSGIEKAQTSEGGTYLKTGLHLVEIERCKKRRTLKGHDAFIAELLILESDNPEHKVGSHATYYVGFDKLPAMGNVKAFLAAACGCPVNKVDEAGAEEVCSERNPLMGVKLKVEAFNIKTQKGNDFTKYRWTLA